jgi:acetyl esterase/lipase
MEGMAGNREHKGWRFPAVTARIALLGALVVALALVDPTALVAQSRGGEVVSVELLGSRTALEIDEGGMPLFETRPIPPMKYAVNLYRLRYLSEDFDGSPATITAQLFVPRLASGESASVLVFGSGTTGISDACAPSLEITATHPKRHYRESMLAYAGLGFIAVFPDYLGFNDPTRPQRYFSKLAEAHVMLDAARAVLSFLSKEPAGARAAPKVFVAGFSQGGHAAFAAADLRASYAPDVPLAGVMGFGATCDVTTLLKEGPAYASHIIYAYSVMYGAGEVDPAALLQEKWARSLAADAGRMCVDEFQVYYPSDGTKLYTPDFCRALYEDRLPETFPTVAARLAQNASGLSGHRIPAIVFQGSEDIVIRTPSQDRFVSALRKAGSPVRYVLLNGSRHKQVRTDGFAASVEWMELIASGAPPPSDGR